MLRFFQKTAHSKQHNSKEEEEEEEEAGGGEGVLGFIFE